MDYGATLNVLVEVIPLEKAWSGNAIVPSRVAGIAVKMQGVQIWIHVFANVASDIFHVPNCIIGSASANAAKNNVAAGIVAGLIAMIARLRFCPHFPP